MEIKVRIIKEHKDGSADAMVTYDKEALGYLVQEGLMSAVKNAIALEKSAQDGIKLRKKLEKAK